MSVTLEDIIKMISVHLGIKKVTAEQHIIEDLGAESAEIVFLLSAIESRYSIEFDDSTLAGIRTVHDLYSQTVRARSIPSGGPDLS